MGWGGGGGEGSLHNIHKYLQILSVFFFDFVFILFLVPIGLDLVVASCLCRLEFLCSFYTCAVVFLNIFSCQC